MFNFTPQEKQALLFLLTVALIGTGVSFARQKFAKAEKFMRIENKVIRLDINKSRWEDLVLSRAVSEKLAREIISHRPYRQIEELSQVKGIGPKRLEKLKNYFFVE